MAAVSLDKSGSLGTFVVMHALWSVCLNHTLLSWLLAHAQCLWMAQQIQRSSLKTPMMALVI